MEIEPVKSSDANRKEGGMEPQNPKNMKPHKHKQEPKPVKPAPTPTTAKPESAMDEDTPY